MTLIFCLKHTSTLEDDVNVWRAKLVQGGYIPSAFHPTTICIFLLQRPTFIANFCVSVCSYVLS